MKKIFTLLFAVGSISIASAQSFAHNGGAYESKNTPAVYGHGSEKTSSLYKQKEEQIQKINREFDRKIMAVKYDRHLRSFEKTKQVKMLERQRSQEISQLEARYQQSTRNDHSYSRNDSHKW